MIENDDDLFKYDKDGRCVASPYRKGLRAKGTNPRALGTNPRAKVRNKWALRIWKRQHKSRSQ